jgi:hypothetical protein
MVSPVFNPSPQRDQIRQRQIRHTHVAHAGDAVGNVQTEEAVYFVRVHVPEAWYDIPIPAVHQLRSGRYLRLRSS